MQYKVRIVGASKPVPIEYLSGVIPPGRFGAGDYVSLDGVTADAVDFSGRKFRYFATQGSTFTDCDFSRCSFDGDFLDSSRTSLFLRCRFDRAKLDHLAFGVSRFEACSFEEMRLKDWRPTAAEFIDCRFSGRFDGVLFFGVPQPPYDRPERMIPWRTRNEFRGNDFSRADLRFPEFRFGVDLIVNTWPSGPEYLYLDRTQQRFVRAIGEASRWEEDAERELALWWLRTKRSDGRELQTETLIRITDWDLEPSTTWPRLWASLAAAPD